MKTTWLCFLLLNILNLRAQDRSTIIKLKGDTVLQLEYGVYLHGFVYNSAIKPDSTAITRTTMWAGGKKNGLQIQYFKYPTDTASLVQFRNDTLTGRFFTNYENGKRWKNGIYDQFGRIKAVQYFTTGGEIINQQIVWEEKTGRYFQDDKLCEGHKSIYYLDGFFERRIAFDVFFTAGKIDSLFRYDWSYWGKSSEVKSNYRDSVRIYRAFDAAGHMKWEYRFKIIEQINPSFVLDGRDLRLVSMDKLIIHGRSVTYHESTNIISEEGFYLNGDRKGEWRFYDKNGKLLRTETY